MKADVTLKQMAAVFDTVNENLIKQDDPANFAETLEDMWETYIVYGFEGSSEDTRGLVLSHYKNMQRLMGELEALLG